MIKQILALCVTLAVVNAQYTFKASDAPKFVAGLVNGILHVNKLSEIEQCFAGSTNIVKEMADAVKAFAKGDTAGYIEGVKDLGMIVAELPSAFAGCTTMKSDLEKLKAWAKIFVHPIDLATKITKNLIFHFSSIKTDFKNGVAEFKAEHYYEAGTQFGFGIVECIGSAAPVFPEDTFELVE